MCTSGLQKIKFEIQFLPYKSLCVQNGNFSPGGKEYKRIKEYILKEYIYNINPFIRHPTNPPNMMSLQKQAQ